MVILQNEKIKMLNGLLEKDSFKLNGNRKLLALTSKIYNNINRNL